MKLLILQGNLQSPGATRATRVYADVLHGLFDRAVAVDLGGSACRTPNLLPFPVVPEAAAQTLAAASRFALVFSCTTPDRYLRYPGAAHIGLTGWDMEQLPPSEWTALVNRMDGLWVPTTHAQKSFERVGVTVPIRLVPCPLPAPLTQARPLPEGDIYNLDLAPRGSQVLAHLCRFKGSRYRFSRSLMQRVGPSMVDRLLTSWKIGRRQLGDLSRTGLLCFAPEGKRHELPLLLAEWLEFKRKTAAASWRLLLHTGAGRCQAQDAEVVLAAWEHVQALKNQLRVSRADVFLQVGELNAEEEDRLLEQVYAFIDPCLGRCFPEAAARALALGKPVVAGRHTAFADCVPADYPYTFVIRPTHLSLVSQVRGGAHEQACHRYVPAPFAVAETLTRLSADSPERRAEVGRRASAALRAWCAPAKVRALVAEELQRLETTLAARFMDAEERNVPRAGADKDGPVPTVHQPGHAPLQEV